MARRFQIAARSGTGGGWHYVGRGLGLVGDQLAQEWNEHNERNTEREAAGAELGCKALRSRRGRLPVNAKVCLPLQRGGTALFRARSLLVFEFARSVG